MIEHPADTLPLVFGSPVPKIRDSERREIAYAHFLWACLHSGSRVKKTLGLKTGFGTGRKRILEATIKQLVALQMGISKERHTRLNKALRRIFDDSRGKPMESVVLSLELIRQFRPSDFPSQQEYEDCLKRNLKVLGAGLFLHPLANTSEGRKQINKMINDACENPIAFKDSREMQTFRSVVLSGAPRTSNGSPPETCNWAQRFPMNVWSYQTLLGACFDLHEKTFVIEDVDEVMQLFKRTWVMLGVNKMVHNICFSWVLFRQYVTTGQVENDLLAASCNLLAEVKNNTKAVGDPLYRKAVNSALSLISNWANKKLSAYHDSHEDNMESMKGIITLAVLSAEILEDCNPQRKKAAVAGSRVKNLMKPSIITSLHAALAKMSKKHNPSKHPSRNQDEVLLDFSAFVQDVTVLAFSKEEKFSPERRKWHPLAAAVTATILHEMYGNELKKSVKRITKLTPAAIEVLLAADKLEKDLNKMAEEDSIGSEDGRKPINVEMQPYKAEAVLAKLIKSWIHDRVDGMGEWVAGVLRPEVWNLQANGEGCVPSAVHVLEVVRDTVEEFFSLPIPMHADFLPDLVYGLDKSVQQYILKATSGYGNRDAFIPTKPPLTRCSAGSKSRHAIQKKEKLQSDRKSKAQVGTTSADDSFDIPQLCVRINTLEKICQELKDLEKQILEKPGSSKSTVVSLKFELSLDAACGGILHLCECIAYKVVFQDLRHVLWDGLYVGEVPSARIGPFRQELKKCLEIISLTPVRDKVKEPIFTTVMKASFDGFLLVLLAGGPSRAFSLEDCTLIEQDFESLTELFRSIGNGFRSEFIEAHSAIVRAVLPLFGTETKHIIRQLKQLTGGKYGTSVQSGLPLAPASDQWSPEEPDTLLRVLCYRKDKAASKFLKQLGLPKNV